LTVASDSRRDAGDEHALKNYVAIILGYAELLVQDTAADDPRRADFEELYRAAVGAMKILKPMPDGRPEELASIERDHIARILTESKGNKQAAARRLGLSRRTLYRRLLRHGLLKQRR